MLQSEFYEGERVTNVVDQRPDGQNGQDVNISAALPAEKNRNAAKAEAKVEKALAYLATLNTTAKPDKWVANASILASLTGCYRPAINTFIEARKQRIDELNASHGLGPGHNRATARTIRLFIFDRRATSLLGWKGASTPLMTPEEA